MRFATRVEFSAVESDYAEALAEARKYEDFVDLTVSNPTRCGFDTNAISLDALSAEDSLRYDADPLGSLAARQAVAAMYRNADPSRMLLTASTSEAYGYLLKMFCNPGDAVLVPSPSYPLFDLLAQLHDVKLQQYPLVYHDGWQIDPASLEAAITQETRAIVAIHPNNPTGHYCDQADCTALFRIAKTHDLPLIVDEVFLDYGVEGCARSFAEMPAPVLTFVMGGLSKLLALPQMKLAWTFVTGPEDDVQQSMERLEIVADTFLSLATPVQTALPAWLKQRDKVQAQILQRIRTNLNELDSLLHGTAISRLKVEGGWCVVLRVPALMSDRATAARLLKEMHVAVHPGSFYGFDLQGWLVVSLLPQTDRFRTGIERLLKWLNAF